MMDSPHSISGSPSIPEDQCSQAPFEPEIRKQIFEPTPGNKFRGQETPAWARKLYLEPLLEGWRREVVSRRTVTNRQCVDTYYWSPGGKKLRSQNEIADFLVANGITKFSPVFSFCFARRAMGQEFTPYEIVRKAGSVGRRTSHPALSSLKQGRNKIDGKKNGRTKLGKPSDNLRCVPTGDDLAPDQDDFLANQNKRSSAYPFKKRKLATESEDRDDEPEMKQYCVCNDVERGQMILCDNDACEIGWYHFNCVMLSKEPAGSWYCPICRGPTDDVIHPTYAKNVEV